MPFMMSALRYRSEWKIEKYKVDPENGREIEPYAIEEFEGNLLLNEGINELWTLVCGTGGTQFDDSNSYIGVGNSAAAAAAAQTDLQGASKFYQEMEAGYPTYGTSQQAVFKAEFADGDGEFAWEEYTIANGNSGASVNLNRKVESKGTKASGEVWTVTFTMTLS